MKMAICDEKEQTALIAACASDSEFVPVWLMLRCGMHPADLSQARTKLVLERDILSWKRAKNAAQRRERIPSEILPMLRWWLARGRKLSTTGYNQLVHRVAGRIGRPGDSPMTLRHTFCLQELRRFMKMKPQPPDIIALVATRMGCREDVVRMNYIDLLQWEQLGGN